MTLPSVTTVIAPFSDYGRVNPAVLADACARGTAKHRLFAAYARRLWIPRIPDELAGYFESWRAWFDSCVEEVILVEQELIHPALGYMGHPDAFVRLKGDKGLTVPDWKPESTRARSYPIQTAAYQELGRVNGFDVTRRLSIHPKRNGGRAGVVEYRNPADISVFISCLNAWKYFNEKGPAATGPRRGI